MEWLFFRLLIIAAITAVGRGFVFAFGLDVKAAQLINKTRAWQGLPALTWIMAGSFGLIGLALWQMLDVDSKLENLLSRPAAFRAEVRSGAVYSEKSPLSLIMGVYSSVHGVTISPLRYLLYIQITNLQDIESKINSYSLSVSDTAAGPWNPMVPIDLRETQIVMLGGTSNGTGVGDMFIPKGTSRLGTSMQMKDLEFTSIYRPLSILSSELGKPIPAHLSVEGWAAFDLADNIDHVPNAFYKFVVRDSAGVVSTNIVATPIPVKGESDMAVPILRRVGPGGDLRGAFIKFYRDP